MEHLARVKMYREQAADCRRHAAAMGTPEAVRGHWLALAVQYDTLADDAMRLSSLVGEAEPGFPSS
jgi:hypothetical protein